MFCFIGYLIFGGLGLSLGGLESSFGDLSVLVSFFGSFVLWGFGV